MIKLRLATPNERKQIIVSEDDSPMDILNSNSVIIEGASINLDGIPLTREEIYSPIGTLVHSDEGTLSVVVKTGNAI